MNIAGANLSLFHLVRWKHCRNSIKIAFVKNACRNTLRNSFCHVTDLLLIFDSAENMQVTLQVANKHINFSEMLNFVSTYNFRYNFFLFLSFYRTL